MLSNTSPKRPACACCGKPGHWNVWGVDVCIDCHAKWLADERFSAGTINAALGLSDEPEAFTPDAHTRYCAEATKRTNAWVAEQRQTARAA